MPSGPASPLQVYLFSENESSMYTSCIILFVVAAVLDRDAAWSQIPYVTEEDFELLILLPLLPKCWPAGRCYHVPLM